MKSCLLCIRNGCYSYLSFKSHSSSPITSIWELYLFWWRGIICSLDSQKMKIIAKYAIIEAFSFFSYCPEVMDPYCTTHCIISLSERFNMCKEQTVITVFVHFPIWSFMFNKLLFHAGLVAMGWTGGFRIHCTRGHCWVEWDWDRLWPWTATGNLEKWIDNKEKIIIYRIIFGMEEIYLEWLRINCRVKPK